MLRPFASKGGSASRRGAAFVNRAINGKSSTAALGSHFSRLMSTQSGDDTKPPTALATLYLEDGSKFTGRSFGCHESVDGEVCI
jgi:hypothetical protein